MSRAAPLRLAAVLVVALALFGAACSESGEPSAAPPAPTVDLPLAPAGQTRVAVVAGGCFWCEQALFEQLIGVNRVEAGYAGGDAASAEYEKVHGTNHAEAVRITYDASKLTFGQLLRVLIAAGDPTCSEGQEPDYGHQYRMAVFTADPDERRVAEAYLRQVDAAKVYAKPLAVTVEDLPQGFFPAEDYHQDFVAKHPDHPYVCRYSKTKIARIRAAFPQQVVAEGAGATASGK